MSLTITDLYREMVITYHAWSNAPRPRPYPIPDADIDLEELSELKENGGFRDAQWEKYVKARDAYFKAMKESKEH